MKNVFITGSSGLIGSELVQWFSPQVQTVIGIDNNQRRQFFGPMGDTTAVLSRLKGSYKNFIHHNLDIRDFEGLTEIFNSTPPDAVIHCAAQPSHDLAAKIPFEDFGVNAGGTLNLLECARRLAPEAVFVFMSTNKVYGDQPNKIPLLELETRFDYADPAMKAGIDESMSIDQCLHSIFGVSKASADLMVQEYGRNFGLRTAVLRGGCLTGPNHRGAELHGFLSYLVRANINRIPYTIFGYKGKQVRDNIHSLDVCSLISHILANPPAPGEVFNLGGGRENSCSMMEAISQVEALTGIPMNTTYDETPRVGDHICYYSNLNKIKKQWPDWTLDHSLSHIFTKIVDSWLKENKDKV